MNTKVRAWHNNGALKKKYLARVARHRKADELIHGVGWENGKGCAVGCTFHKYDHEAGAAEIGFPVQLIQLQDAIFEWLKNGDAQSWPEQFLGAARVGADLSMVWPKFALWMLRDRKSPVVVAAKSDAAVQRSVRGVAKLYAEWVQTGERSSEDRWAAAVAAAWAAGDSAWAAGDSAWAAAQAAARAAAQAADQAAARAAWCLSARNELLRLMKECR